MARKKAVSTKAPTIHARFAAWLDELKLDLADAGKLLGCHGSHVSRLRRGQKWPGLPVASAIELHSKGLIRSTEWVEAQRAHRRGQRAA